MGLYIPVSIFMSVLLPAPLCPNKQYKLLFFIFILILSKAFKYPKFLQIFLNSKSAEASFNSTSLLMTLLISFISHFFKDFLK